MGDRHFRHNRMMEKEDFVDHIREVMGVEPPNVRGVLAALSHPDVIEKTIAFFGGRDRQHMCQLYDEPWNCAREAEAKYENIKYGWTAGSGIGFDESWCEPCRKRVLGGEL